jgi:hypothetical protein
VIAGDKINHAHRARRAIARPEGADAFERSGEGNHRTGGKRHDNVATYGGFVPDFEGGQESAAAFPQQRRGLPVRRRSKVIQLDHFASGGNLKTLRRGGE